MPNIRVELLRGRTTAQRREFAAAVTQAAVEILGARQSDVRILFEEVAADHVANGGVLASEDETRAGVLSKISGQRD